ncbi:hypothetical protein FOA43_002553 [Brettanomyces nanus]|uniref:Uncharacterized protein n=1 Tax=Eeniella nana TaxID=13502 RepID=A0A875S2R3_EENNA|nr:uncharacterized protein FOA43_002553 [Brettanomyces nanus]QPG75203.1 hypothetical protein FOA43_002553 [Brettanomyces nanus]
MLNKAVRCACVVRYFRRFYAIPVGGIKGKIRTTKRPHKPAQMGKLTDDDDFEFFAKKITKMKRNQDTKKAEQVESHELVKGSDAWLVKFNSMSERPISERVNEVSKFFAKFCSYDKIEKLSTDFVSCIRQKLIQFGDIILKDVVKDDDQLKTVYSESNPNYAYLLACIHILNGFDHSEVIKSRMSAKRVATTDELIYEEFKTILNKEQSNEQSTIDDDHSKEMASLVQAYMRLPKPRSLHMQAEDMEDFLETIGEHLDDIELKTIGAIYQDVMDSGMMLTSGELKKWMASTLEQFHDFDSDIYQQLKLGIEKLGYKVTRDHYNLFLAACLNSQSYDLFQEVLQDMVKCGLEPDRYTLTLMNNYSGLTADMNLWLNVMELRMTQYPYMLSTDDYEAAFSSLISLGGEKLGKDILRTLISIRDGYRDMHREELEKTGTMDILEIDNSTKQYIPYEHPLELFDLVTDQQELIMIYPRLCSGMFEPFIKTCSTMEDLDKLIQIMDSNGVIRDLETFHSIFDFLLEHKQVVKFERFQHIVIGILNDDHDEYLCYLMEDEHNLRAFVTLSQMYTDVGELDANNDQVVNSFKLLWGYLEQLGHGEGVDEETYTEAVKSVLVLSKANVN